MSEAGEYFVKITGPGIDLERDISKALGEQLVVMIMTGGRTQGGGGVTSSSIHPETPTSPEIQTGNMAVPEQPSMSIREFFNDCQPKRNPDKILTIGVYLKRFMEKGSFKRDDVVEMFAKAADPVPANISRDIRWTVNAGWIAQPLKDDTSYYVTNDGEKVVEAKFPKEAIEKTKQPTQKKSRSSKNE